MRHRTGHSAFLRAAGSIAAVAGLFLAFLTAAPATAQIPDKFTNLKVLPADIAKQDLIDTMKGFAMGLGVRCWYCHKGEGDDLSTFDFASDEKGHKEIARQMLRMTMQINHEVIAKLPAHADGTERGNVRCVTCHRGAAQPKVDP